MCILGGADGILCPSVDGIGDGDGFINRQRATFHIGDGNLDRIGATDRPGVGEAGTVIVHGTIKSVPRVCQRIAIPISRSDGKGCGGACWQRAGARDCACGRCLVTREGADVDLHINVAFAGRAPDGDGRHKQTCCAIFIGPA